ncbi:MAG TPA: serine/threonine protein phosphatase [Pseudonocardiaceae bacterium]|jgi:protein phosphatase|nr:serine/threonine protein phosphatase [Pseudonocardiaceae bacterium]
MLANHPLPTVLPHWDQASERGPRQINADATAVHTDPGTGLTAYVVADGVGDDLVAARTATIAAEMAARIASVQGPVAGILAAQEIVLANDDGGDCVLVVAVPQVGPTRTGCDVAWVGDCRAYHWNGRILEQITNDHTVAEYFRGRNQPTTPRMEHLVTTSVRTVDPERIGTTRTSIANSRLLLCTDGVHKLVDMSRIRQVLDQPIPPAGAANMLVGTARELGSKDNATALVVDPAPVCAQADAA